jgi:HD-like signal output (HDOD) protein
VDHLPSAPKIVPRLWYLLNLGEQQPSLYEIGRLIRLDPGLTARVLRMGNHLSVEKGEPCFTVEDAINHIGFRDTYALVSEVSVSQVFVNPLNTYNVDAEEMWRLSLSCGLAAELLAERTGEDASVAYTIGLLHGIGMTGIDHWVQREAPQVVFFSTESTREFIDCERGLLGFTQADVGAAMLKQWDFPLTMIEPLRWQYSPRGSAGYTRMACLLQAAKWLRTVVCADDADCPPPVPTDDILKPIRVSADELVRLVVDLRYRLGAARNVVEAALER